MSDEPHRFLTEEAPAKHGRANRIDLSVYTWPISCGAAPRSIDKGET